MSGDLPRINDVPLSDTVARFINYWPCVHPDRLPRGQGIPRPINLQPYTFRVLMSIHPTTFRRLRMLGDFKTLPAANLAASNYISPKAHSYFSFWKDDFGMLHIEPRMDKVNFRDPGYAMIWVEASNQRRITQNNVDLGVWDPNNPRRDGWDRL